MFPSYTLAPTPESSHTLCSSPGLQPPRPSLHAQCPAWRLAAGAPLPSSGDPPDLCSPSPRPLLGEQGLLTYRRWAWGPDRKGSPLAEAALQGRAGVAPGPRPADPAVGAARSQAGGGLRGDRGAGRGGAAREAHGGIARHQAGQLRSARLRYRLCNLHGSQPPPGAKPKPRLAGGEEGGGACWGGAKVWWEEPMSGAWSTGQGL